jgi:tetratricopeptide (TPR) repeat protein
MSQKSRNNNNNIILFPHTIEHHMNEAIQAGNDKKHEEAIQHYEQILRYEPDHVSAQIGLAVTWMEMRKFKDAIELTSEMLERKQGDYYHILRIHVAALLQCEQYGPLRALLLKTLNEKDIPTSLRSEFESLLEACSLMDSGDSELWPEETDDAVIRQRLRDQPQLIDQWIAELQSGNVERQFFALEQLQFTTEDKAIKAVLEWIQRDKGDPLLKTLALRTLRKMGVQGTVLLKKWGQMLEIDTTQFPVHPNEFPPAIHTVLDILNDHTHQDPTLCNFASQVWMEYLYTIYPQLPNTDETEVWAAALHFVTAKKLYDEVDGDRISADYKADGKSVDKRANEIENMISARRQE